MSNPYVSPHMNIEIEIETGINPTRTTTRVHELG
jgi:hypothetical protein